MAIKFLTANFRAVNRMDFQQTYIPHEYLELRLPPGIDAKGNSTFSLDPNHLHIWPRHSFMLIALPNKVCHVHNHQLSVNCFWGTKNSPLTQGTLPFYLCLNHVLARINHVK